MVRYQINRVEGAEPQEQWEWQLFIDGFPFATSHNCFESREACNDNIEKLIRVLVMETVQLHDPKKMHEEDCGVDYCRECSPVRVMKYYADNQNARTLDDFARSAWDHSDWEPDLIQQVFESGFKQGFTLRFKAEVNA